MFERQPDRRIGGERNPACQHLEDHDGERVGVRAGVERVGARLLGRHVDGRADDGVRDREPIGLGIGRHQLGDTEVQHLRGDPARALLQHDVIRLDVAMDEPRQMRGVEGVGDLSEDVCHLVDRQPSSPPSSSRSVVPSTNSIAM